MKHRWLLLPTGILLAAVLAYLLRDLINHKLIVPLAYLWWRIGIYYHSVPQDRGWAIVIIMVCLMALASIRGEEWSIQYWNQDSQFAQGPLEELMGWMIQVRHAGYYKWLIANRLGKLARSYLIQRDSAIVQQRDGTLEGSGWAPPEAVGAYLKSGLNRPIANIRSLSSPHSAALNLDPQQVVEYLESQMENRSDGN